MRRRSWFFFLPLVLALLAITVPAASAQAPATVSPGAPDVTCDLPSSSAEAPLYATAGGVIQLDGCTADKDCPDGTHISCSGQVSCIVGSIYVECDGDRWPYCPGTCADGPTCVENYQCVDYCNYSLARCSGGGCCIC